MLTVSSREFDAPIRVDDLRDSPTNFISNYRNCQMIDLDGEKCVKAFANVVGMTLRPVVKAQINLTFYAGMGRQGRTRISSAAKLWYADQSGDTHLPPVAISDHSLRQLRDIQDGLHVNGRVMADRLANCGYRDIQVAKTATGHILSVTSDMNGHVFRLEFRFPRQSA